MTDRPQPCRRSDYAHFERLGTRWHDNDIYGHMNNVVHYQLFDTAVNGHLVRRGVLHLDGRTGGVFLVASSACDYFAELAFPDEIEAGLAVQRLGASSVTYRIGLFRAGSAISAATGRFVHIHVDRATRRPAPIPSDLRAVLEALSPPGD